MFRFKADTVPILFGQCSGLISDSFLGAIGMVSDMKWIAVRIGPERCPISLGMSKDKEWSDAGLAARISVRSVWIEETEP